MKNSKLLAILLAVVMVVSVVAVSAGAAGFIGSIQEGATEGNAEIVSQNEEKLAETTASSETATLDVDLDQSGDVSVATVANDKGGTTTVLFGSNVTTGADTAAELDDSGNVVIALEALEENDAVLISKETISAYAEMAKTETENKVAEAVAAGIDIADIDVGVVLDFGETTVTLTSEVLEVLANAESNVLMSVTTDAEGNAVIALVDEAGNPVLGADGLPILIPIVRKAPAANA